MIDGRIADIFTGIEKEYKNHNLQWSNYFAQLDWDIVDGKLKTFVKNIDKKAVGGNLRRSWSHELRDNTIIDIFKMINIKSVLDIGADTGLFLEEER